MTEFDPMLTRRPQARRYAEGISAVPFRLPVADMQLPLAGAASYFVDRFICVAPDASIESAYVMFDSLNQGGGGIIKMQLIQALADRVVEEMTALVAFNRANDEPILMPVQNETLVVGRAIYLRIRVEPGSGTQFWNATPAPAHIQGTIFFVST